MSYRETEIKLAVADAGMACSMLEAFGATVETKRHFEDNLVLDTEDRSLRLSGKLLRLRITGGKRGLITFKGQGRISDGVKDREEVECRVSDPENLLRILSELGFALSFRYQKYRTVYRMDSVDLEFCVDETPIGAFVEIEGDVEQIHIQSERLGFKRSQYITDSYATLYLRWCDEHNIQSSSMMFP